MAWFKRKDKKLKDPEKKSIPDGLWDKCPSCNEIIDKRKKIFLVLNLGTGFGTSVFEMIDTFERVNDLKIKYEVVNRRICDSAQIFANCQKSKEILGWSPKRSLEDICRDGWKWQKNNLNGYES